MTSAYEPARSKAAWTGADFAGRDDWISPLTGAELDDLDRGLRAAEASGKRWGAFDQRDFPLTVFGERIDWIADQIKNGYGFVVLRGLPVKRYSREEICTIYWGIASHMGTIVSQNARGTVIETITDLKPTNVSNQNLRSYVTAQGQSPHSDYADVVGLLCVNRAKEGGESTIASLPAIYNRTLAEHPEYLDTLYSGFYPDYRGEGPTGDPNETGDFAVPVFTGHGGKIRGWFHKRLMAVGTEKYGLPLSALQRAALDYIEGLGQDPLVRFDMNLQPGDLQLLNNYTTMHYRSAFVDSDEYKRLMLRVWINFHEPEDIDPAHAAWVRRGLPAREWVKDGVEIPSLGVTR